MFINYPSADTVRCLLNYDDLTGVFTWKADRGRLAKKGSIAGCLRRNGYIEIVIHSRLYKAHRLAWLYVHGDIPTVYIDHINGVRSDNRIANLRLASFCENQRNCKRKSTNSSGVKGVSWHARLKKWRARIYTHNKRLHLGLFTCLEEAEKAIQSARNQFHGQFARHS